MQRRQQPLGQRGLGWALCLLWLLLMPATALTQGVEGAKVGTDCCCAPAETPPTSCCAEPDSDDGQPEPVLVGDMDCGCEAAPLPAPGVPNPAPLDAGAQLSQELDQRVRLGAELPATGSAVECNTRSGCGDPPPSAGSEDLSVLHRRASRGTQVVHAVLSVARI